jgi:hypothetical protein
MIAGVRLKSRECSWQVSITRQPLQVSEPTGQGENGVQALAAEAEQGQSHPAKRLPPGRGQNTYVVVREL